MNLVTIGKVTREENSIYLDIDKKYIPALKQLDHFSHMQVIWWFNYTDNDECRAILQNDPPYEDAPTTGVFASRSPVRPNPIGLTVAEILEINHETGRITIKDIDAVDDSPVLDIKAYFPVCDRVKDVKVPPWTAHWPEWFPEEGMKPEDYSEEE